MGICASICNKYDKLEDQVVTTNETQETAYVSLTDDIFQKRSENMLSPVKETSEKSVDTPQVIVEDTLDYVPPDGSDGIMSTAAADGLSDKDKISIGNNDELIEINTEQTPEIEVKGVLNVDEEVKENVEEVEKSKEDSEENVEEAVNELIEKTVKEIDGAINIEDQLKCDQTPVSISTTESPEFNVVAKNETETSSQNPEYKPPTKSELIDFIEKQMRVEMHDSPESVEEHGRMFEVPLNVNDDTDSRGSPLFENYGYKSVNE